MHKNSRAMHLKPNKIYATTKTLQNWIKSVIHPQMHSLAPVLASQSKTAARSKPRVINKRIPQKQKRIYYLEEIYLKSNLEFITTYLSSCIIACYHLDSRFSKNLSWCPPKATRLLNEKLKTCNFWPDSIYFSCYCVTAVRNDEGEPFLLMSLHSVVIFLAFTIS